MALLVIATAAIVFALLAAVAAWWPRPVAPAVCIVAIDVSATSFEMNPAYKSWMPKLLQQCAGPSHGKIIIRQVDGTEQVTSDLQSLPFTGSTRDSGRVADEIRRISLQAELTLFPARATAPGADLLTASGEAANDFLGSQGARDLYVLSSGLTTSNAYATTTRSLTEEDIATAVGQLPRAALSGVRVHMLGAGATTPALTPDRLARLRAFWQAYYAACGAQLVAFTASP